MTMLEGALWWAARGVPVLPLHTPLPGGKCSCGRPGCRSAGKHPRIPKWADEATTDPEAVRLIWERWPDANVGAYVFGAGLLAVDIDGEKGFAAIREWERTAGALGRTMTLATGGGGAHLLFRAPPGREIKNKVGLLDHVDIRGKGGQIVVWPSVHASGNTYAVQDDCDPADAPRHLLDLIEPPAQPKGAWRQPDAGQGGDVALTRVRGILRAACERIAGLADGRRAALIENAFNIGGYLAAGHMEYSEAFEALCAAGRASGTKHPIEETVRYGLDTGIEKPKDLPPQDPRRVIPSVARLADIESIEQTRDAVVALGALMQDHPEMDAIAAAARKDPAVLEGELTRLSARRGLAAHVDRFRGEIARKVRIADAASRQIRACVMPETDENEDDRPTIHIRTAEAEVVEEAIAALAVLPSIYHRLGMLVRVLPDPPRIQIASTATIQVLLAEAAKWVKYVEKKETAGWEPAHPPQWAVGGVRDMGVFDGVRRLQGIVTSPVLRRDGTVLVTPGYDSSTELFAAIDKTWKIPEHPTLADAKAALNLLVDLVVDFPFASDAHRSAWLAGLLTPFARPAIAGPCPLFLVDANTRGAGKTLLTDMIGIIATGSPIPKLSQPKEEEEERKRILAILLGGQPVALIDNVTRPLGSGTIDCLLTSTTFQDRILGRTEQVSVPATVVWFATGNNIILQGDTARRSLHIRIEAQHEHPEERSGFRHPALHAYALEHRDELVVAALTILRGYAVSGDAHQLPSWGSFEDWSARVRAPLVWLGLPDPVETHRDLQDHADPQAAALARLLEMLYNVMSGRFTAADVIAKSADVAALREALVDLLPAREAREPTSRGVSAVLRRYRGRMADGRRLVEHARNKAGVTWTIEAPTQPWALGD